jgi:hypothetical protein
MLWAAHRDDFVGLARVEFELNSNADQYSK